MTAIIPELFSHQKIAIEKALHKFALFWDPGTGKSRTGLEIHNKSDLKESIIISPLNVCRNWRNEVELFSKTKNVIIIAGQSKDKKLKLLKEFINRKEPSHLIINTECVRSEIYLQHLIATRIKFLIVDESHDFKSPTSLQGKGLIKLNALLRPTYLYLLSGTPVPNGHFDAWSTFYLTGMTNLPFYPWRKKYFYDVNQKKKDNKERDYFPIYQIRASAKEEFQRVMSKCCMVAKKDEVLDLPPLIRTEVFCELTAEQKRHYTPGFDDLLGETVESNALARTVGLQQIVAGFHAGMPLRTNRLDALRYAIEQTNGEQFIVWTIFTKTYDQIRSVFDEKNITHGSLTGEFDAEHRQKVMEEFQAGKIRALVAHPKAGGVGVNLTKASYCIYYLKNFDLVADLQSSARNYRAGSEIHKRITRIDIIAENTIDEKINKSLKRKESLQDFILGLKEKPNGKSE